MLPAHEYAQYAQVVQMLQQLEIPGHRDLMHLEPVDDAESNFDSSDDSEKEEAVLQSSITDAKTRVVRSPPFAQERGGAFGVEGEARWNHRSAQPRCKHRSAAERLSSSAQCWGV